MNSLSREQLQQHVPVVAWLNIAGSILVLLVAVFLFLLLPGIGMLSGDQEAAGILSIVGIAVGGLLVVIGLPGLLAGVGLLKRKNWGRILAIVVGFLNLLNFPVGTILGIYTLWVLFQESATAYFE